MVERTKHIEGWDELRKFVDSINPYKKTIVLTGWVNEVYDDKLFIKSLVFSTRPISILQENEKSKEPKNESEQDRPEQSNQPESKETGIESVPVQEL